MKRVAKWAGAIRDGDFPHMGVVAIAYEVLFPLSLFSFLLPLLPILNPTGRVGTWGFMPVGAFYLFRNALQWVHLALVLKDGDSSA